MRYTLRMRLRWFLAFAWLCLALAPARAEVRLAVIFGDHMLLQHDARVHLWGSAAPGELIRVRPSWYEHDAAVTADLDGRFDVALTTPGPSGPFTIRFSAANELLVSDVMIGQVWLASGQSNMEMPVAYVHSGYSGVKDWQRELTDAARPRIRFFEVENTVSAAPLSEVKGRWRVAEATTVKDFSATAWFFAKQLEAKLDMPIGVVAADWGGTPAEAWTGAKTLAEFEQFAPALEQCALLAADPRAAAAKKSEAEAEFQRALGAKDKLALAGATERDFDDGAWSVMPAAGIWSGELAAFDGIVWMRHHLEIPKAFAGRDLELSLGMIDDDDSTWFNGQLLGATSGWETPRVYEVSAAAARAGAAVIAVRVLDTGGRGGFHGDTQRMTLRIPGGQSISLAGSWRLARGAALSELPKPPQAFEVGPYTPSALFNGMIAPLRGCVFEGVIWYQGESNVGRAEEYAQLFPAMIAGWREHFDRELIFLYAQIAPFAYESDTGQAAALREAQTAALALERTGMALTIDIGDPADIHPKNKQDVGRRLAELALASDHRMHSPQAELVGGEAGKFVLRFHEPVEACGPSAFELAGEDGVFHPAAQQLGPAEGEVSVSCAEVLVPKRLRYAWGAAAAASLRSSETRLPVAQFSLEIP